MDILLKYFPNLTPQQIQQFSALEHLYKDWNQKINVVSRKDVDELYLRHVLHSLGIAKIAQFSDGTHIADVGTGGGFPGVPLAIMFPKVQFSLVDSIGKKIKVVDEVIAGTQLKNVKTYHSRIENVPDTFDYIVSRAVARMDAFVRWTKPKIKTQSKFAVKNGIFYLKGGDLTEELSEFPKAVTYSLTDFFDESFFETKKVVYLSV